MTNSGKAEARSEKLEKLLDDFRANYASIAGKPFDYFFCPILMKDEDTSLAFGHIVNKSIPNSSRECVVQRRDVDSFFGSCVEADWVAYCQASERPFTDLFSDPNLNRTIRPRIFVGDEVCDYHRALGHRSSEHTEAILEEVDEANKTPNFWLHISPSDLIAAPDREWSAEVDFDCRVPAVVSLIKAAYLTLFRLLGYKYVLSAAGNLVGNRILGEFYRAFNESIEKAKLGARSYFKPYIHMVRPTIAGGRGTIEDNSILMCLGARQEPFAYIVSVRTLEQSHGILMPCVESDESVATFEDFLRNDNETIRGIPCSLDFVTKSWREIGKLTEVNWPKRDVTFEADSDARDGFEVS